MSAPDTQNQGGRELITKNSDIFTNNFQITPMTKDFSPLQNHDFTCPMSDNPLLSKLSTQPPSLASNVFRETMEQINEFAPKQIMSIEEVLDTSSTVKELRSEIALLQQELLKTSQAVPKDTSPLSQLAAQSHEVSDKSYAVDTLEKRIATLMTHAKSSLESDDAELERYGKKHANLVKQARLIEGLKLSGLSVLLPHGIANDKVHTFLTKHSPNVFTAWESLGQGYATYPKEEKTPYLDTPSAKIHLDSIANGIRSAFDKAAHDDTFFKELASEEFLTWLDTVHNNNDYLMVRSTGSEDTRQTANAGGNLSVAYVPATREAFCKAAGDVAASYFGFSSMQNRINAGINPFKQELKLAVTAQQLIGEAIGGKTQNPAEIPISLVLFTSEPLYIGGEKFRTMRISATLGHGEGVVGGLGIGTDTVLLLVSEAHPDRLYVLYENSDKPERLAPVETPEGIVLKPVANPENLRRKPVLSHEMLSRLYTWGVVGEAFFDNHPTDMEIVIKGNTIYPVQARPINRPDLLPTYLDLKKVAMLPTSPVLEKMQGKVLVPGKASVVIVTDPNQVNFANTLKQAEEASYQKTYQAVIVTKPEPVNSHPVVNFSSLGMPCLVIEKATQIENLLKQACPEHPLAIDMQTGAVYLWDNAKGKLDDHIVKGFAVHPAKIAQSLPISVGIKPATGNEAPQEVKDLILEIGSAATREMPKRVCKPCAATLLYLPLRNSAPHLKNTRPFPNRSRRPKRSSKRSTKRSMRLLMKWKLCCSVLPITHASAPSSTSMCSGRCSSIPEACPLHALPSSPSTRKRRHWWTTKRNSPTPYTLPASTLPATKLWSLLLNSNGATFWKG